MPRSQEHAPRGLICFSRFTSTVHRSGPAQIHPDLLCCQCLWRSVAGAGRRPGRGEDDGARRPCGGGSTGRVVRGIAASMKGTAFHGRNPDCWTIGLLAPDILRGPGADDGHLRDSSVGGTIMLSPQPLMGSGTWLAGTAQRLLSVPHRSTAKVSECAEATVENDDSAAKYKSSKAAQILTGSEAIAAHSVMSTGVCRLIESAFPMMHENSTSSKLAFWKR